MVPPVIKQEPYDIWPQEIKPEHDHPDIPGLVTCDDDPVYEAITLLVEEPLCFSTPYESSIQDLNNCSSDSQDVHVSSGERPFECKLCGKKFMRKCHLQVHQVINLCISLTMVFDNK